METEVKTIQDFRAILKRRRGHLVLPALIIFVIAAVVAFALPPIYRSTATILIEEQEIPREYVMSMVTSYAEQRLQSSNQRIMSSTRLIEIINRFNLYADLRRKMDDRGNHRQDAQGHQVRNDQRRRDRPPHGKAHGSHDRLHRLLRGEEPGDVQQVANVLASLYLEENLKVREEKTAGASKFMEDEMKEVQASLANQDAKIAEYKQKHVNSLPELSQMNLQELERLERSIEQFDIQLRSLGKERVFSRRSSPASPPTSPTPIKTG